MELEKLFYIIVNLMNKRLFWGNDMSKYIVSIVSAQGFLTTLDNESGI